MCALIKERSSSLIHAESKPTKRGYLRKSAGHVSSAPHSRDNLLPKHLTVQILFVRTGSSVQVLGYAPG